MKNTIEKMKTGDLMSKNKRLNTDKIIGNKRFQRFLMLILVFIVLFFITSICINNSIPSSNKILHIGFYLGIGIFVIVIEALTFFAVYSFKRSSYNNNEFFLISITLLFAAIITMGSNIISGYLIPFGFLAMILSMIFEPVLALSISLPFSGVILCITNFNQDKLLMYIISCLTVVLLAKTVAVRNNLIFNGLLTGIINSLIILSLSIINKQNILPIVLNCGMTLVGSILTSILVIGILPILEHFFEIITNLKLLELSNPNEPLLKKMLFEAPGTYHHSIIVGNLAEAAAETIGANSMLARVGAYYHDIGKIKRPYFFKENQMSNDNPHDKITPKLSTIIIISHIKDGIELAEKYKIPKYIKAIIEEHHGTSLVKYFYNIALNDSENTDDIDELYYRYAGPNPLTKESGIVMLADSVEASVRSLINPTVTDIQNMVNKIFKDKIDDGQLNSCKLTMKDLYDIKLTFIRVLEGVFHSRIEYPDLNEIASTEEIL